jgi:hypothetical protein
MTGWDGHTLALYVADQAIWAEVQCPHSDTDLTTVSFERQPRCRTEPREPGVPWPDCSVARGWADVGHDAFEGGARFDITSLPSRIGWRWDQKDGLYVWPLSTEDIPAVTA